MNTAERYEKLRMFAFLECSQNKNFVFISYLVRMFAVWRPFVSFGSQDVGVFLFSLAIGIPLLLGWVIAMTLRSSKDVQNKFRLALIILSLTFSVSVLPSAFQLRHRYAAFEALQIICLFYVVTRLYEFNRSRVR